MKFNINNRIGRHYICLNCVEA